MAVLYGDLVGPAKLGHRLIVVKCEISKGKQFDKIIRVESVENNEVSLRTQYVGGKIHECPKICKVKRVKYAWFRKAH
jgi:hypothetical protein